MGVMLHKAPYILDFLQQVQEFHGLAKMMNGQFEHLGSHCLITRSPIVKIRVAQRRRCLSDEALRTMDLQEVTKTSQPSEIILTI